MTEDSARNEPGVLGAAEGSTPLVLIRGDATEVEVAAVVAVLQAVAGAAQASPEPAAPRSTWAAPARMHRTAHDAGPGGWRASALPR